MLFTMAQNFYMEYHHLIYLASLHFFLFITFPEFSLSLQVSSAWCLFFVMLGFIYLIGLLLFCFGFVWLFVCYFLFGWFWFWLRFFKCVVTLFPSSLHLYLVEIGEDLGCVNISSKSASKHCHFLGVWVQEDSVRRHGMNCRMDEQPLTTENYEIRQIFRK